MSSGGLRGLEHPPKVWHNSQLSSCVTTILTDKQQLVAKTNNKLTGLALNGSFSSLLDLLKTAFFVIHQAVFKNALTRGVVNILWAWLKNLRARLALPQILDTPLYTFKFSQFLFSYKGWSIRNIRKLAPCENFRLYGNHITANTRNTVNTGITLKTGSTGVTVNTGITANTRNTVNTGITVNTGTTGITVNTGITANTVNTGIAINAGTIGITVNTGITANTRNTVNTGITVNTGTTGITVNTGITANTRNIGITVNTKGVARNFFYTEVGNKDCARILATPPLWTNHAYFWVSTAIVTT